MVSATSALSAKCMCGADFSRLKSAEFALGRVAMTPEPHRRRGAAVLIARAAARACARRSNTPIAAPARTAGSTTALRSRTRARPAARAHQQAGPGGEAHRPEGDEKARARQGSRGREEARAGGRRQGAQAPQPRAARHLHQREGHRGIARARPAQAREGLEEVEKRIDDDQEAPGAVPEGARRSQDRAARASRRRG